jgi:hypothetical protein
VQYHATIIFLDVTLVQKKSLELTCYQEECNLVRQSFTLDICKSTCILTAIETEVTRQLGVPTDSNTEIQSEVDTTSPTNEMQQGLFSLYRNVQLLCLPRACLHQGDAHLS